MNRKSLMIGIALLLTLAPSAVFALAQADPDILLDASPLKVNVAAGGSVKIVVLVYGLENFEGKVKLESSPPKGVTVMFDPNLLDVPAFDKATANMTVNVASDATQGKVTLTVMGTAIADPKIKRTLDIELTIGPPQTPQQEQPPPQQPPQQPPPQQQPVDVRTTTVTTTVTSTTTTTVTEIITTKTPEIATKTTAQPTQVTDYTLPAVAVVVVALSAVAAVALRRG